IITNEYSIWYLFGKTGRLNDKPSIVFKNGSKIWMKAGIHYREGDKPACKDKEGRMWYKYGVRYRNGNKPSYISHYGDLRWYKRDRLDRADDYPSVITTDGNQEWIYNLQHKRKDKGPDVITKNGEAFYNA